MQKKEPLVKICRYCGAEFTTDNSRIVYCSDECRARMKSLQMKAYNYAGTITSCECCGQKFIKVSNRNKFCSRECYHKFNSIKPSADGTQGRKLVLDVGYSEMPSLSEMNGEQLVHYGTVQAKRYEENYRVVIPEGLVKAKERLNKT